MDERDTKISTAALLIIAGGLIGATLAFLYAPQSGQRTRRDLRRCARRVKTRADEAVEDLTANINDLVDSIGEKTDIVVEKGKGMAGSARKELMRLIEEGTATLDKFRSKLSRM